MSIFEQPITLVSGESKDIVFDEEFPEPPVVTVMMESKPRNNNGIPCVSKVTTKGCKVHLWTPDLTPDIYKATVFAATRHT